MADATRAVYADARRRAERGRVMEDVVERKAGLRCQYIRVVG